MSFLATGVEKAATVEYLMVPSASMGRDIPVAFQGGGPHAVVLLDAFDAAPDVSNWVTAGNAMNTFAGKGISVVASGLQPSTYRGTDGLYGRSDLAGLNLAQYPSVLVEMGNMKHQGDAAVLASRDGQAQYAKAVARGIAEYLGSTGGHRCDFLESERELITGVDRQIAVPMRYGADWDRAVSRPGNASRLIAAG